MGDADAQAVQGEAGLQARRTRLFYAVALTATEALCRRAAYVVEK